MDNPIEIVIADSVIISNQLSIVCDNIIKLKDFYAKKIAEYDEAYAEDGCSENYYIVACKSLYNRTSLELKDLESECSLLQKRLQLAGAEIEKMISLKRS